MVAVADVLGVVEPDRAALPAAGAGGQLVAMTVRVRANARSPGDRFAPASDGLPSEATTGQRVRVWRIADGRWFEPFADWTTSWGAQWSPDRNMLAAFVHREGGAPTLAVWNADDRAVRDLAVTVGTHFTFERAQWVLDGTALVAETHSSVGGGERQSPPAVPCPASVRVLRSDDDLEDSGAVPILDASDLSLVGLDGHQRLLVKGWTVRSWRVAPDGRRVGCLRVSRLETNRHQLRFDLEVIELDSGRVTTVAREITQEYGLGWSWSPDGATLAYLVMARQSAAELWVVGADGSGRRRLVDGDSGWTARGTGGSHSEYQSPRWLDNRTVVWHRERAGFLSVPLGSGAPVRVATPLDEVEQWLIDPDGSLPVVDSSGAFYSVRNSAGEVALDRIDPSRDTRHTVARYPGSISPSQLHVGGWAGGGAFLMRSADQPGELWTTDAHGARRVAALNPDMKPVHVVRRVSWGDDEDTLAAGVLVPTGSAPESGWPLVISVYGGDRSSRLVDQYDPDNGIIHSSLLTSQGWAVVYPDLPVTGSDPMKQFAPLLRAALDHLPDVVPIDRRRIALVGNSYGSYTVLSLLVTMPQTFCAAALSAPVINPLASYGALYADGHSFEGLWESGLGRMGCPPWEAPQTWLENTPYLQLDRVDTPVLIGVGGPGLPGEEAQAEQLFAGLRRLGRKAELRHYPGEGHAPSNWGPKAYGDFAGRVVEWITQSSTV